MKQRLKGILVLLPLILVFFLGDTVFTIFLLTLGAIAYYELHKAFALKDIHIPYSIGAITAIILGILSFASQTQITTHLLTTAILAGLIVLFSKKKIKGKDIVMTVLSALYAFIPYWLISILDAMDAGRLFTILIFLIAFSTDIFAMISGKLFGKHPLSKISPKKTVEGSIGGILGAVLICAIYGLCVHIPAGLMLIMSAGGSIISQLGDLFASSIKRYCGIKDFGNLIPGHGGCLDRFDSVNFVAMWVFLFVMLLV